MTRYSKEQIEQLRKISALDYMKNYHSEDIVKNGRYDYYLRDHDSLHFSNGKWYWWSRKIGGCNAIDYLMKVENYSFIDACNHLSDLTRAAFPISYDHVTNKKPFVLPERDSNNNAIIHYLCDERKVDRDIVDYFIDNNMLYQSKYYKNAVFVGYDGSTPAYAFKRSINKNVKLDHSGSNKSFSFSYTCPKSDELHVFEAAIDMLSYMTLLKQSKQDYMNHCYLSLAGVSKQDGSDIPISLRSYLQRNPDIKCIVFHLDNDEVGIKAAHSMMSILYSQYECVDAHPTKYKDFNEVLVNKALQKSQKISR